MIPISAALGVFTVPFVGYPIICTAVVAITIRLIRNL